MPDPLGNVNNWLFVRKPEPRYADERCSNIGYFQLIFVRFCSFHRPCMSNLLFPCFSILAVSQLGLYSSNYSSSKWRTKQLSKPLPCRKAYTVNCKQRPLSPHNSHLPLKKQQHPVHPYHRSMSPHHSRPLWTQK